MATPAQIDEQIQLEREQIRQGLKELRRNTRKLEEKEYASAAVYGVASVQTLIPLVVEQHQGHSLRITKAKPAPTFKEIWQYLADIEPEAAAAIASKVTMDKVFSPKKASSQLQNVADAIGTAVENECMMRHYERNVPGLLHTLKENYWHRSIGTHQKVKVITTLMNKADVPHWQAWGRANRIRLVRGCLIASATHQVGLTSHETKGEQDGKHRHNSNKRFSWTRRNRSWARLSCSAHALGQC